MKKIKEMLDSENSKKILDKKNDNDKFGKLK